MVGMRRAWVIVAMAVVARADVRPPDPLADPGFQHFYNLEYDEALAEFRAAASRDPSSADAWNHIAQTILFRRMFRAGSLATDLIGAANSFLRRPKMYLSADDQQEFSRAVNRAIDLSNQKLKQNPNDLAALYSIGVSYGIRANYNFLVRKAWIDALTDTATARKMHNRALAIDPNFADARLVPGVHEYVAGSLTWALRMLGSAVGVPSDRNEAIRTLEQVAQKGVRNRYDAEVLLCAIYRREKRPREAIPMLDDLLARFPRGYLVRLELAEAYSDLGDRARALAAVDEAEELKRAGAAGYTRMPEAKVRYTRGDVLFAFRQLDGALEEMKYATAHSSELDPVTAAGSWLRLGQIFDLLGQRNQAIAAYKEVVRIAPDSDAGGDAKSYISSRYKRP